MSLQYANDIMNLNYSFVILVLLLVTAGAVFLDSERGGKSKVILFKK